MVRPGTKRLQRLHAAQELLHRRELGVLRDLQDRLANARADQELLVATLSGEREGADPVLLAAVSGSRRAQQKVRALSSAVTDQARVVGREMGLCRTIGKAAAEHGATDARVRQARELAEIVDAIMTSTRERSA